MWPKRPTGEAKNLKRYLKMKNYLLWPKDFVLIPLSSPTFPPLSLPPRIRVYRPLQRYGSLHKNELADMEVLPASIFAALMKSLFHYSSIENERELG